MFVGQDTKFSPQGIHRLQLCHLQFPKQFVPLHKDNLCTLSLSTGYLMLTFSRSFLVCVCIFFFPVLNPSETFSGYSLDRTLNKSFPTGKMIVCPSMNITIRRLGGVSKLRMFMTTRPNGYVNMATWLGISQFF